MEVPQNLFIAENLDKLIRYTICNSLFLAFLESKSIIEASDVLNLEANTNRFEKAKRFYEIIATKEGSFDVLCEALEETQQTGALDILKRLKPIRFDVRPPVSLFTGRIDELTQLHKNLSTANPSATLITQTASVTGLGGIGKTELCRRYVQKYSDKYAGNVVWIGAEKSENMANSFRILAKDHLGISLKDADGEPKNIKAVVDEVYNFFHNRKCLFVFDNAVGSESEELDIFLPTRVLQKPHLIITSRDKNWEQPFSILVLDELKEHEAIEFVKKGLIIEDNSEDEVITKLVTRLQRFPLALQQAISYIKQQKAQGHYEIDEYLQAFELETRNLLEFQLSTFISNKYAKTTFTTWKITTDVIAEEPTCGMLAMNILNMISYIEPDKIPTALLIKHDGGDEDEIHSALQILVQYSMINCQPTESMFNIHRLVQEVARIELRSTEKEENTIRQGLQLFQPVVYKNTVDHAMLIFNYAGKYKKLVVDFRRMPTNILMQLLSNERDKEGEIYGTKALDVLKKHVADGDVAILYTEYWVTRVESMNESPAQALQKYHKILQKYRAYESTDKIDSEVLEVKYSIATQYILQQEGGKALQFLLEIFNKRMEKGWISLEGMVDLVMKLSQCYDAQGNCIAALQMLQFLVAMFTESNADVPPKVMQEVGMTYKKMGSVDKAYSILRVEYEKMLSKFGDKVGYSGIGHSFAELLVAKGKFDEAIEIVSRDYEFQKKTYGAEHKQTLWTLIFLGEIKGKAGFLDEGTEIVQNCHNLLSKSVGELHIATMKAKTCLAAFLTCSGKFEEALESYLVILDEFLEIFGPYNEFVLDTIVNVAGILSYDLEAYEDSMTLFQEVEKIITTEYGKQDPRLRKIKEEIRYLDMLIFKALCSNMSEPVK